GHQGMIAAVLLAAATGAGGPPAPAIYCNAVDTYGRVGSYKVEAGRANGKPALSFQGAAANVSDVSVSNVRGTYEENPGRNFKFDATIEGAAYEGSFDPEVIKPGEETWTLQIRAKAGDRRGLTYMSGICGRKENFAAAYSGKRVGEIVSETRCYGVTLKGKL